MKTFILMLIFFTSPTAWAQVVFDAAANDRCGFASPSNACGGGGTTLTYALTVGAGSDRALAVFTTVVASATWPIAGVTYNGVALGLVISQSPDTGNQTVSLWSLPAGTQPASGTHNVVVTLSVANPESLFSGAIAVSGVDQATTFTSTKAMDYGSGGASGTPLVAGTIQLPSSGPNDLVISYLCAGCGVDSPGSPMTQRWNNNGSCENTCNADAGATAPGGTTSLLWVASYDDYMAMLAASFKATGPTTKWQKSATKVQVDPARGSKLQVK